MMIREIISSAASSFLSGFSIFDYIGSVGSYGPIKFTVSSAKIVTPTSVTINRKSRVIKHTRLSNVDITEFSTRELKTVTIPIKLLAEYAPVLSTIAILERICERGEHYPLILGGKKIGKNTFRLDSVSDTYNRTSTGGIPLISEISLSLEEYISEIDRYNTDDIVDTTVSGTATNNDINENNSSFIEQLTGGRLW